jgi:hypothetical protein
MQSAEARKSADAVGLTSSKSSGCANIRWLSFANDAAERAAPAEGTPAGAFLRHCGYAEPIPNTLRGYYKPPALIAIFGEVAEIETGALQGPPENVHAIQLISLNEDGSPAPKPRAVFGDALGWPIWLAPIGDSLGLIIAEKVEDALLASQATGLGAIAAGYADNMPAIVDSLPACIESATILPGDGADSAAAAEELARRLAERRIEARLADRCA